MPLTTARPWLSAVLLGLLNLSPAHAGMTPGEVKAFEAYKAKAADQGLAMAQYNLGICYENGYGVAKDYGEAAKWYRKAADQGDAMGQYGLGVCYEKSYSVAKDMVEAAKWYRKAADQGLAKAQANLGVFYAYGEGVAEDQVEAYAYLNLAGITDEVARKNLSIHEKTLSPEAIGRGQQRTKELQAEIEAKIAAKAAGK